MYGQRDLSGRVWSSDRVSGESHLAKAFSKAIGLPTMGYAGLAPHASDRCLLHRKLHIALKCFSRDTVKLPSCVLAPFCSEMGALGA